MRIASTIVIAVLLLTPSANAGGLQDSNQTIVVRATPLNPEQARDRAVNFVKSTGVANGQKQVARWVVPVCIKVFGLAASQEARVVRQMLAVAEEAKIPVGKVDCEPNLTVTVAADAVEAVRYIHARKPNQLREVNKAEKEQLLNGSAPVRWWYATEMMDRDGVKANSMTAPWITAGDTNGGVFSLPEGMAATQQYNSGSNVRTPTIRSLYGATVIVDATKAGSTPIDSIAAYAAMVAFAEMDAGAPPPDSILGLFQPSSVESSLTDWDMAFLKSLYRMPLDRRSRIQRGHLVEALLEERLPTKNSINQP
jgi:hypothetical protein